MRQSKLHFYSLGRVANNKELDNSKIQVTPVEASMFMDGSLVSVPVDEEEQGEDAHGNQYSASVTSDTALEAEWLPLDPQRTTAPDVRRGERVLIWQFADSSNFYWSDLGLDQDLRRLETVRYLFNANPEEKASGRDPANCYTLEISTHNGAITFTTTDKNGEFCTYAIQLNTKEGKFLLIDDEDNEIMLDSKEREIWLKNKDETSIQLLKKDLNIKVPDNVDIQTGKNVTWKVGGNFDLEIGGQYNIKAANTTMDTPVTITKTLDVEQGTNMTGKLTMSAPFQAAGGTSSAPINGPNGSI